MKTLLILAVAVIALLAIVLFMLFQPSSRPSPPRPSVSFTELLRMKGQLNQAVIRGATLEGTDGEGRRIFATIPADPTLAARLADAGTEVTIAEAHDEPDPSPLIGRVVWFAIYAAIWLYPMLRIARALERIVPPPT